MLEDFLKWISEYSWNSVIPVILAMLPILLTYLFTKNRERAAEIRNLKIKVYKEFADTITGVLGEGNSYESKLGFANACNNVNLFASKDVVLALNRLIKLVNKKEDGETMSHDEIVTLLYSKIRKDIGIAEEFDTDKITIELIGPGSKKI